MTIDWEPIEPGIIQDDPTALASALEAIRRRVCAYGGGHPTCDCKYGLAVGVKPGSEQTGCPELRAVIFGLLHPERPMLVWGTTTVLPRESP